MQVSYRPTLEELTAAAREQLRLRGQLTRLRVFGVVVLLLAPVAFLTGQWLFGIYAVAFGVLFLLASTTTVLLRRGLRRAPNLHFDTWLEATDSGVRQTIPTAVSGISWAYYAGWSRIPEGLVLVHALQPRMFSFVPSSALTPELEDVITRNVRPHPRARAGRP